MKLEERIRKHPGVASLYWEGNDNHWCCELKIGKGGYTDGNCHTLFSDTLQEIWNDLKFCKPCECAECVGEKL